MEENNKYFLISETNYRKDMQQLQNRLLGIMLKNSMENSSKRDETLVKSLRQLMNDIEENVMKSKFAKPEEVCQT